MQVLAANLLLGQVHLEGHLLGLDLLAAGAHEPQPLLGLARAADQLAVAILRLVQPRLDAVALLGKDRPVAGERVDGACGVRRRCERLLHRAGQFGAAAGGARGVGDEVLPARAEVGRALAAGGELHLQRGEALHQRALLEQPRGQIGLERRQLFLVARPGSGEVVAAVALLIETEPDLLALGADAIRQLGEALALGGVRAALLAGEQQVLLEGGDLLADGAPLLLEGARLLVEGAHALANLPLAPAELRGPLSGGGRDRLGLPDRAHEREQLARGVEAARGHGTVGPEHLAERRDERAPRRAVAPDGDGRGEALDEMDVPEQVLGERPQIGGRRHDVDQPRQPRSGRGKVRRRRGAGQSAGRCRAPRCPPGGRARPRCRSPGRSRAGISAGRRAPLRGRPRARPAPGAHPRGCRAGRR